MKDIYKLLFRSIAITIAMFSAITISAQDIHFTFGNPKNTNDGNIDYFEVDVFIQTINITGSLKLGSGQLYFNYNELAFGSNVFNNSNFEVTSPNDEGYIAGQFIDAIDSEIYGNFTINDNKTSRVSWSFFQTFNSNTFVADNVTDSPKKLCHLKFRYIDVNESPLLKFEDGNVYDDQFVTACGSLSEDIYCNGQLGLELFNDTFDSLGARLANSELESLNSIKIHPNPVKDILTIKGDVEEFGSIELYTVSGQLLLGLEINDKSIAMSNIESGVYFLKVNTGKDTHTFKVVKE